MVLAEISWEGKANIYFIDTHRAKVNSESYTQLLVDNLLLNCRRLYPRNNNMFQQDGAPSHTSRVTQANLEEATPEFTNRINVLHKVLTATQWIMRHETL